jgi:LuxR family maltose regulon positive regulatory protein
LGHPGEAENCLKRIEQSLGMETADLLREQDEAMKFDLMEYSILVEIAVMRMELAIEQGDLGRVFELSRLVLPYLEDEKIQDLSNHRKDLGSVVFFVLGMAYKITGKLNEAADALLQAAELGQERGNAHILAGSAGRLASIQSAQGHLSQAIRTCQQGLKAVQEKVGKRSPVPVLLHAELGNLLYEQNDLEPAQYHLQEGINVGKPWGFLEAFVPGYTGLARVKAAQGDWKGAFVALDELTVLGKGNSAIVMPAVESLRASLLVAQGKVDAASHWAINAGLNPDGEIDFHRIGEWMVFAHELIARQANSEAVDLLIRMVDTAEAGGWFGKQIAMRVLLALAHQKRGDNDQAMVVLEQALRSAEPEGYVRVFLDEGEPMQTMLQEAETMGIAHDYIPILLAAFETDHIQVKPPSAPSFIDPLSERELEVLRLLKTELSGPEIADELVIALSTLRTHTQNIYSKLGVSSRRAAVRKSEELNMR